MLVLILVAFCLVLFLLVSLLCLCLYIAMYRRVTNKTRLGRSAAVVVLGDIGRSPRMCLHVESLANEGWKVAVIGYKGTSLPPSLLRSSIKHRYLSTPPRFISKLPRFAFALVTPIKVIYQSLSLFWQLAACVDPPPEIVLVQTPPALPTLFVVRFVCMLLKSHVIIDWHNLAYTILALRMGPKSILVRLAENLERITGRTAYAHLFVTQAMMNHLDRQWNLVGKKVVLYDRPPSHFRKATVEETHQFMCQLVPNLSPPLDDFFPNYQLPQSTPFTTTTISSSLDPQSPGSSTSLRPDSLKISNGAVQLRSDRPALVVSSTSWTADEDFSLLLHAAQLYETRAKELAAAAANANATTTTPTTFSSGSGSFSFGGDDDDEFRRNDSFGSPSASSSSSSLTSLLPPSPNNNTLGLDTNNTTRISKQRRRPSLGVLRSVTLPNEPVLTLPKLLIIVTGKGDLKSQYETEIARLEVFEKWKYVRIRTIWLAFQDYPVLLGSSDIGVSLHSSSSGLDLPMKVVDMLGCKLPVCALDFPCISELIKDHQNGLLFRDAFGLSRQWQSLFTLHPLTNWLSLEMMMMDPFLSSITPKEKENGNNSPTPSFTLLSSPLFSHSSSSQSSTTTHSTWSKNWKSVLRPILLSLQSSPSSSPPSSPSSSTTPTPTSPSSSIPFLLSSPSTTSSFLRHRKKNSQLNSPSDQQVSVPHIQVSS